MAKSLREKRGISSDVVDTLMLRVNPNQDPTLFAKMPVQICESGKWKTLGTVELCRGENWVPVSVVWPSEDLAVWEKNLLVRSVVERNPENFKIKEESHDEYGEDLS